MGRSEFGFSIRRGLRDAADCGNAARRGLGSRSHRDADLTEFDLVTVAEAIWFVRDQFEAVEPRPVGAVQIFDTNHVIVNDKGRVGAGDAAPFGADIPQIQTRFDFAILIGATDQNTICHLQSDGRASAAFDAKDEPQRRR